MRIIKGQKRNPDTASSGASLEAGANYLERRDLSLRGDGKGGLAPGEETEGLLGAGLVLLVHAHHPLLHWRFNY